MTLHLHRPARVPSRITEALGLRPGDSIEAHEAVARAIRPDHETTPAITAALGLRPGATIAEHLAAANTLRLRRELAAALPEWLRDEIDVAGEAKTMRTSIAAALGLDPNTATETEVLERIRDLFAVPESPESVIATRDLARGIFAAKVHEKLKVDPKADIGTAQAQVSREHPKLFAAARAR